MAKIVGDSEPESARTSPNLVPRAEVRSNALVAAIVGPIVAIQPHEARIKRFLGVAAKASRARASHRQSSRRRMGRQRRRVSLDATIRFEGRSYSVPFRWAEREVEVRGCAEVVQVWAEGQI